MRSIAYLIARFLGDVSAIQRGRIGPRVLNKLIGRHIVRRLWR